MIANWMLNRLRAELEKKWEVTIPSIGVLLQLADLKQVIIPSSLIFYEGNPVVRQYFGVQDQTITTKQHVLQLAASLVHKNQHPIFQSIRHAAAENGLSPREVDGDVLENLGSIGRIDHVLYVLGNEQLMNQQEIELGVTVQTLAHQFELDGKYTLFLAQKHPKRLLAIFACEYELKTESAPVVSALSQMQIELVLLTSVKTRIAKGLGNRLGISLIHSELSEQEKERIAQRLVQQQPASAILVGEDHGSFGAALTIGIGNKHSVISLPSLTALPAFIESIQTSVKAVHSRLPFSKF